MTVPASPVIVDNLFDAEQFDEIAELFQNCQWKYGWGSHTIGESFVHWNKHFAGGGKSTRSPCETDLDKNPEARPISLAWQKIKAELLPDDALIRCYANAHTFGLDGTIHRDNPPEVQGTTTILYCHRIWPLPWGGETMFYSQDGNHVDAVVFPKPGRIAFFSGSMMHAAKSPNRVCRQLRVSLVFKSIKNHDLL